MFLAKRGRPDILTGISFLNARVQNPISWKQVPQYEKKIIIDVCPKGDIMDLNGMARKRTYQMSVWIKILN